MTVLRQIAVLCNRLIRAAAATGDRDRAGPPAKAIGTVKEGCRWTYQVGKPFNQPPSNLSISRLQMLDSGQNRIGAVPKA